MLHAELLGSPMGRFAKCHDAGVADDAVEACEIANSVGRRDRIEWNRPRSQLGKQFLTLLRAQGWGQLGMAEQNIIDPGPGRFRRGPNQPPGATPACPFVTNGLFHADREFDRPKGVAPRLERSGGDGGAIAVHDKPLDIDRQFAILGPVRSRGPASQESPEIASLAMRIDRRVVGGQDVAEIIELVGFNGLDDASVVRFDLSFRLRFRLRPQGFCEISHLHHELQDHQCSQPRPGYRHCNVPLSRLWSASLRKPTSRYALMQPIGPGAAVPFCDWR